MLSIRVLHWREIVAAKALSLCGLDTKGGETHHLHRHRRWSSIFGQRWCFLTYPQKKISAGKIWFGLLLFQGTLWVFCIMSTQDRKECLYNLSVKTDQASSSWADPSVLLHLAIWSIKQLFSSKHLEKPWIVGCSGQSTQHLFKLFAVMVAWFPRRALDIPRDLWRQTGGIRGGLCVSLCGDGGMLASLQA